MGHIKFTILDIKYIPEFNEVSGIFSYHFLVLRSYVINNIFLHLFLSQNFYQNKYIETLLPLVPRKEPFPYQLF